MGTRHRTKLADFPLRFVTTTFKDYYAAGQEVPLKVTHFLDAIGWQNQTSIGQITS